MMSDREEWKQFVCPYFVSTCKTVMTPYFAELGLTSLREAEIRCTWLDSRVFADIAHLPETSPNYEIQVLIGLGATKFDASGNWQSVPLWSLVSELRQQELSEILSFSSEAKLVSVLEHFQSVLLPEVAAPLLSDPAKLLKEIHRFAARG